MIAPLHTAGPVAVTQDGSKLFTCVGEEALLTDLQAGKEICRFSGVCSLSFWEVYKAFEAFIIRTLDL